MNLISHLNSLGIEEAFRQSANFSKMTDNEMYVSNVVHKSVIEVSPDGTEAAAVTEIEMDCRARSYKDFKVDHPFMFMIKYKNLTLFMGKVHALPDC